LQQSEYFGRRDNAQRLSLVNILNYRFGDRFLRRGSHFEAATVAFKRKVVCEILAPEGGRRIVQQLERIEKLASFYLHF
jgi:hypothetical protein